MNRFYLLYCLSVFFIFPAQATFVQHPAELLYQHDSIQVVRGKLIRDIRFDIKINDRRGEKYSLVTIPYSRLKKISKIRGAIRDKNGSIIRELKTSEITEESAISGYSFFEDNFISKFILKHNNYPYIISYSYRTIQTEFFYLDLWTPILDTDIPTKEARLTISVPPGYQIHHKEVLIKNPVIDTLGSIIKYTWNTDYAGNIKAEKFMPDYREYTPSVSVVPDKFHFDQPGSQQSWKEYGIWENDLLKGTDDLQETEKHKIRQIIDSIPDSEGKIRALYHYLQDETRYINVSIETGGMKPFPASYVAANKYGDCKALTNYLRTILKELDIKANYTNIHAGDIIKNIDKDFPAQQFNHVILSIPMEKDTLWLDCTSDGPFNYAGTFIQNREAFVIDGENSYFVKTPPLRNDDVKESRKIMITPGSDGKVNARFTNTCQGSSFESLQALTQIFSGTDKEKRIKRHFIQEGFDLISYSIIKTSRDSKMIALDYMAESKNFIKQYGNEFLLNTISLDIPVFEKPAVRKYPVQFNYPVNKTDTIEYRIPEGYSIKKIPASMNLSCKYGTYTSEYSFSGDCIKAIKNLIIHAGLIPHEEYEAFYTFINDAGMNEKEKYILLNQSVN